MIENNQISVVSFYSFVNLESPEELVARILFFAKKKYIKGTVILSKEGFNGSISGDENLLHQMIDRIKQYTNASEVSVKVNYCSGHPFQKIKVKLKDEIVSLKAGNIDVENLKGTYIKPQDWDEFTSQEDVIVVDTRNDYESAVGSFKNSVIPNTVSFREFPNWVNANKNIFEGKKIAMCCTGGIRCEKSTAYMRSIGYDEVYHLEGGILQYLEDTGNKTNFWQGECFVFDDRRAVDNDLLPSATIVT